MLSDEVLAVLEGEGLALYAAAKEDPDQPPPIEVLCRRLLKTVPERVTMVGEGDLTVRPDGRWRIRSHRMLPPERERFVRAHELAHWWLIEHGLESPERAINEAMADTLGAIICAPSPAFRRACKTVGHRVSLLAKAFVIPQPSSLLRIGEVTGRPVALVDRARTIIRGEPFAWPDGPGLVKATKIPPETVHPVRVDGRVRGLMASGRVWPRSA